MATAALVVTCLVAFLHFYFMVLETFLWTQPRTYKMFGSTKEEAETTKLLAANQGVYNGTLAACIVWAVATANLPATFALLVFVVIVGAYGAATVSWRIFVVQAFPALLAIGLHAAAGTLAVS